MHYMYLHKVKIWGHCDIWFMSCGDWHGGLYNFSVFYFLINLGGVGISVFLSRNNCIFATFVIILVFDKSNFNLGNFE